MHLNYISLYGLSLCISHPCTSRKIPNFSTCLQICGSNPTKPPTIVHHNGWLTHDGLVHVWSVAILVYDLKENSDHVDWDLTLSTRVNKKQASFVLVTSINNKSANLQRSKPKREKNAIRVLKVVESFSSGLSVQENWWSSACLICINSCIWPEAKLG